MNMKNIHPDFRIGEYEAGFQELLRNLFIKTNFVPGIRHIIGWRGLKDSSGEYEAWTAKVKEMNGIYGISYNGASMKEGVYRGDFSLFYFPHPDEELVENFSIPAGMAVFDEDYITRVRDFMQHADLLNLFNLGRLSIVMDGEMKSLGLMMESLTEIRITATEGLNIMKDGQEVRALEDGETDQQLPALEILFPFFEVIASSFTFNLGESPSSLHEMIKDASYKTYDAAGAVSEVENDEIKDTSLLLVYGDSSLSPELCSAAFRPGRNTETFDWDSSEEIPEGYAEAFWWNAHRVSGSSTLDKKILGIDHRPHFIVITGFLGSGKTTFLQNFIEYQVARNQFVAVIQNEIGEISLDSKLLDQNYAVTEMDEGCVCCTLVGNLKGAISDILSEFTPDYIVLETTGVANPANLISEIFELEETVRFDSVTVLVDSLNMEKTLAEYEVAREQLRTADILLLNKADLIDEKREDELLEIVRRYNPHAPVIFTKRGDINPSLIYGPDSFERKAGENEKHDHGHHHHHDHHHVHGHEQHHSHHFDSLSSLKVNVDRPLDRDRFLERIALLPAAVFRVKGIISFSGDERPLLFQYVAGRYEISEYSASETDERFLIFIGQNMDEVFSADSFIAGIYD